MAQLSLPISLRQLSKPPGPRKDNSSGRLLDTAKVDDNVYIHIVPLIIIYIYIYIYCTYL